jgi:hypothetical protein
MVGDRNVGAEIRDSIRAVPLRPVRWFFVPDSRTKFLNARQSHHKLVLEHMLARIASRKQDQDPVSSGS